MPPHLQPDRSKDNTQLHKAAQQVRLTAWQSGTDHKMRLRRDAAN
tara:strand:- start:345 stop:479 length:135 start_codon:yes stop_codon:yes gene_type:complete